MNNLSEEIKRAEKAILRKEALEELLEKARKFDQLVEAWANQNVEFVAGLLKCEHEAYLISRLENLTREDE